MIVDPQRQIFLADWGQQHVLRISSQGVVSLLYNGLENFGPEGLAFRDGTQFPPLETNAIEVRAGELLEEFELVLAAVAEVTGTLVDPSGAAVEGVDVKAITAGGQLTGAATTTDHAGHFVLSPLENETEYQLSFRHPEFARRRRDPIITEGETTDLGTFTLEPGSALSGEVVDLTGAALPLAKVLLQHRQGNPQR